MPCVILCLEDEMNFEVDWLLLEYPWEKDAGMERMIEELGASPMKMRTEYTCPLELVHDMIKGK